MSRYAREKARTYAALAELERTLADAEPDSLDWSWWSMVLEYVEQLPRCEQAAWKAEHLETLRRAVRSNDARVTSAFPGGDPT